MPHSITPISSLKNAQSTVISHCESNRQISDSCSLPPSKSDGSVYLLLLRRLYLRLANQGVAAETATVVTLFDLSTAYESQCLTVPCYACCGRLSMQYHAAFLGTIHGSSRRAGGRSHIRQLKIKMHTTQNDLVGVSCNNVIRKKSSVRRLKPLGSTLNPGYTCAPTPCAGASGRSVPEHRTGKEKRNKPCVRRGMREQTLPRHQD